MRRPWWFRASVHRVSTAQNNIACYIGPFSITWDHEFSDWSPETGFAFIAQPRRTLRIWFRVFTKLLEVKLWRDKGNYCECGKLRQFCEERHRCRMEVMNS